MTTLQGELPVLTVLLFAFVQRVPKIRPSDKAEAEPATEVEPAAEAEFAAKAEPVAEAEPAAKVTPVAKAELAAEVELAAEPTAPIILAGKRGPPLVLRSAPRGGRKRDMICINACMGITAQLRVEQATQKKQRG